MNNSPINRSKFFPDIHDVNFGIFLIGLYILFDFGSIQGIFEFVNALKLPFLVAWLSLLYAVILIFSGKVNFSSSTTMSYFLVCALLIIYAQIATINPVEKKDYLTNFLQYLANYIIIVACVKKPSQYVLLLDVFILAVVHASFRAIMSGGLIWDSLWLADQNTIGLLTAFVIPFVFFLLMYYKSRLKKTWYILALVLIVTANVIAMSRGGTIAMAVAGLFCWLFIKNKFRTLLLLGIAVILIFQFASPKFFTEMNTLKQGTEEGTAFDRVYSWHLAVMMFMDHPIIGVGPSNYAQHFSRYNLIYKKITKRNPGHKKDAKRAAHSTPLQWLSEMGIIGTGIFLLLQIALFKNWRTLGKYREAVEYAPEKSEGFLLFKYLSHANAIGQVVFWVGALFLTLILQPFYWILIPFSEACKNLLTNFMEEEEEETTSSLPGSDINFESRIE